MYEVGNIFKVSSALPVLWVEISLVIENFGPTFCGLGLRVEVRFRVF